jgi:NADH-quinone oxidoreductase subunit L
MENSNLIWIPLLPFLGFLLNGLLGKRLGPKFVAFVAAAAPIGAFLVAVGVWNTIRAHAGDHSEHFAGLTQHVFDWIHLTKTGAGGATETVFSAPFALLADGLSSVMCLVITGIGSLIHLYSITYMKGDRSFHRFFAYLNLFTAFMLILVLADNLLLLFVGWEGVGLCSYLLIGFWFEDAGNAKAGQKAFVVNRIGDFGVLLAMFLCHQYLGTIDTREVLAAISNAEVTTRMQGFGTDGLFWGLNCIDWIALLLFLGATGKSAQIPLYVWLPDAMAGPTPVSALIHAATMVTSGIYLCCRLMPLFQESHTTMAIIAGVGACTALVAALIAMSQNDIKKVLAYSTVSQLGYMFFAIGMGFFAAAFFHVVTHAFFKALLFLGSGSVIHAMHHEQDMRRMGGLRKQLPWTYRTYLIGTLAIAGVPPLAGFFSKDEILFGGYLQTFGSPELLEAMHVHHVPAAGLFWGMTVLTAGLTAFYMFRSVAMTFWGESRVEEKLRGHVHEPWGWITPVLLALTVGAALAGFLNVPHFLGGHSVLGHFTGLHHAHEVGDMKGTLESMEWTSLVLSVLVGLLGIGSAIFLYGKGRPVLASLVEKSPVGRRLQSASSNLFWVDDFYLLLVGVLNGIAAGCQMLIEVIIQTLVDGTAYLTRGMGNWARRIQTGFIPSYLLTFGLGVLVLVFFLLFLVKDAGS